MSLSPKIEKIIFLDTVPDAKMFLNHKGNQKLQSLKKILCIAMNPNVYVYLKQKNCNVHSTLPYFTQESHRALLLKSDSIMQWLRRNSDLKNPTLDIHESYNAIFSFWARLHIHTYLFVIEVVSNALQTHQPKIGSAFLSPRKKVLNLWIEPQERVLGMMVNEIAKANNISYEGIDGASRSNFSFFSFVQTHLKFLVKTIIHYFYIHTLKARRALFGVQKTFLFTTKSYQMASLAEQIQKKPYFLTSEIKMHFKSQHFFLKIFGRKYFNEAIALQQNIHHLKDKILDAGGVFSYRAISFSHPLVQKIQNNILNYFMGLYLWSMAVQKFLIALKPKKVISAGNRGDDSIIAELCQNLGIDTILISHGSHVKPKNEYEKIEWGEHGMLLLRAPFSHMALQSPLAEGYLDVFPVKGQRVKTGPLIWGRALDVKKKRGLFKKYFNQEDVGKNIKVIVHAGTCKESNRLRFYVYETPDEYIQSLRDLAYCVEKLSDVVLIIKFRPSDEISIETLRSLIPLSQKVVLSVGDSFLDVLSMADLLVSFSSTCIEEALQNKIPVLLYGGGGRYQHVPGTEIKRGDTEVRESAIYFIKEAQHLDYGITKIFEGYAGGKNTKLYDPYIYPQHLIFDKLTLL